MVKNPFTCAKVPPDIGVFKDHFPSKDDDCRQSKKDGEQERTTKKFLVFGQEILEPDHAARALVKRRCAVASSFTLMACPIRDEAFYSACCYGRIAQWR